MQPALIIHRDRADTRVCPGRGVEPGLKPNQPKARIKVPRTTRSTLCPGAGLRSPLSVITHETGAVVHGATPGAMTPTICVCLTPDLRNQLTVPQTD